MGDAADMADLERMMRSPEGSQELNKLATFLKGRRIIDVTFTNEIHSIGTQLLLDNGDHFECLHPMHDLNVIRSHYDEVLQREYFIDFPDRKPKDAAGASGT